MTSRLFAAVVPPADVLDALDAFVEPRRTADADLRWVARANWHLTLAFFGDVPDDRLEPLQLALDAVRGEPFAVSLAGGGAFPNAAAARVLYYGVDAGADPLTALSRRVRTAADRVAVPSDNARHRPHLTLARVRRPRDVSRWLRIVDSFPPLSFRVESFQLVRSELHPSGPAYRPLQAVPLGSRPDSD